MSSFLIIGNFRFFTLQYNIYYCFQAFPRSNGKNALKKMVRVLIVEDEPIVAMLLGDVVESLGHMVCDIVATEADAVAIALTRQPDLMIVDSGLSNGSGVAAIRTILKQRAMPHIFVTGDKRSMQLLAPDSTILEKPFFIPDLVRAIEAAMADQVA